MKSKEEVQHFLRTFKLWDPGVVAVTDLGRFQGCVAKSTEGIKAVIAFNDFIECFEKGEGEKHYQGPSLLPPRSADSFIKNHQKENKTLQQGKKISYECSSFAYSAIAKLMLNEEIRKDYNILQVGTMRINQGFGQLFAHNIAVIVPKGIDVPNKGPLPEGALVIDPWARSLGHTAATSLGVSPKEYIFSDTLFPMQVNYNSSKDTTFSETLAAFDAEEAAKEESEISAINKFQISDL